MTLLTQTADRVDYVYQSATAAISTPDGLARPVSAGVLMGYTTAYSPQFTGTIPTVWNQAQSMAKILAPLPVWWSNSSWPININLLVGFGMLTNPPAGSKRVTAFFEDQTLAPISRVGYLIDRATGAFVARANSSAVDGSFTAYAPTTNPVIVILLPNLGDSRNAVVLDNIVPVFP